MLKVGDRVQVDVRTPLAQFFDITEENNLATIIEKFQARRYTRIYFVLEFDAPTRRFSTYGFPPTYWTERELTRIKKKDS